MKPVVLQIGLGLHAQKVHAPILRRLHREGTVEFAAVVDREAGRFDAEQYLDRWAGPRPELLTVTAELAGTELAPETERRLDQLCAARGINTVFVSTEPLAHRAYAGWALRRGLHLLVDKPPVGRPGPAVDPVPARAMAADFAELEALAHGSPGVAGVFTHRRYHAGWLLVRDRLREVAERTGSPVTSVTVEHTDGEWRMPWEIADQEYHPFNQGYGMLLHSGYHTVDTALWVTSAAGRWEGASVSAWMTMPRDNAAVLGPEQLAALFPAGLPAGWQRGYEDLEEPQRFGELDARLTVALRAGDRTPTVLTINMLHTSFSRRGWPTSTGRNLYTGNGRVRQETYLIQQGPFQSIKVESYKAGLGEEPAGGPTAPGGSKHWRMTVFRNASLFPEWPMVEEFDLPAGDPKGELITDFLQCARSGRPDDFGSALAGHHDPVNIVAAAYESWAARPAGGPEWVEVPAGVRHLAH